MVLREEENLTSRILKLTESRDGKFDIDTGRKEILSKIETIGVREERKIN